MRLRDLDVSTLRAALWAELALRQARRGLRQEAVTDVVVRDPPDLPDSAARGVAGILRRRPHTCLERALVLQRWHAAHGRPREVVIGVRGTRDAFQAHAWLDDEPNGNGYAEILRVPPR